MDVTEFEKVFEHQIEQCRATLIEKAKEYAPGDRLGNFKKAASMRGVSPREALAGMMAKHTISIYDLCGMLPCAPVEMWEEKITDHINYLVLLRALVSEEKGNAMAVAFPDSPRQKETLVYREKNAAKTPVPVAPDSGNPDAPQATAGGTGNHGGNNEGPHLINDYANLLHPGKIRAKREVRGETQYDVAKAIGVHKSAVSSWETGITVPTQNHYDALVNHFYPYWHKAVKKGLPHGQNSSKGA